MSPSTSRSRVAATALLVAALLSSGAAFAPAQAAAGLQITKAQYDSPGKDDRSNASLNAEWVRVTNSGTKAVQLKGVVLRDVAGHRYTFGKASLKAGASVTVHTGRGSGSAKHVYWGRKAYVWNNDGDTATLLSAAGKKLDTCTWRKAGKGSISC